ncbi:MAG: hypothetical protein HY741_27840 [Chloroflexi bacterium]|nr:hypothetical protein [Chloroflexota bacterium]
MDLNRDEYSAKKREIERKREEVDQERIEKETWLQDAALSDITANEIESFCSKISAGIDLCTLEDKRNILKLLAVTITFDGESITIGGGVPVKKVSTSSLPQYQK